MAGPELVVLPEGNTPEALMLGHHILRMYSQPFLVANQLPQKYLGEQSQSGSLGWGLRGQALVISRRRTRVCP